MPAPGSMLLRECGSPVPSQTCCVSDGAIAIAPSEATRLSSKTGRHVCPLLVDFHTPPAAAATKTVLLGPGMPTTSDNRPMKFAGPMLRHFMLTVADESRVWLEPTVDSAADAARARSASARERMCGV